MALGLHSLLSMTKLKAATAAMNMNESPSDQLSLTSQETCGRNGLGTSFIKLRCHCNDCMDARGRVDTGSETEQREAYSKPIAVIASSAKQSQTDCPNLY